MTTLRRFILLCMLACLAAGCDQQNDTPPAATTDPSPRARTDTSTEPTDADAEADTDPDATDPDADDDPADDIIGQGAGETDEPDRQSFAQSMRRIEQLEAEAQFAEALQLCRQLRARYRTGERYRQASEKLVALTEARRRAVGLEFAMRRLGPDNPRAAREAAQDQLIDAGEVGRIFLRKAVRDGEPVGTAAAAVELLGRLGDDSAAELFVNKLQQLPPEPLRSALVEAIAERAALLDLDAFVGLAKVHDAADLAEQHRQALTGAVRAAAANDFAAEALQALADQTLAATPTTAHDQARALALIYAFGAGRDEQAFNAMFPDSDPLDELRAWVDAARSSPNDRLARRAGQMHELLLRFDFDRLREGLVAWWGFDDQAFASGVADVTGQGHGAKVIGDAPGQAEGVIGTAAVFDGNNRGFESQGTEAQVFAKIHQGSYSFAAWVKPAAIPEDKQPDMRGLIMGKEGWHIGLMLTSSGVFAAQHYHVREQGATVTSRVEARVGQWQHVALSVDYAARRMTIYVDGVKSGEQELPRGSSWDMYDGRPVRVGLARFGPDDWAYRFKGAIDEVAVYSRALTEQDVASLVRISTPRIRKQLSQ